MNYQSLIKLFLVIILGVSVCAPVYASEAPVTSTATATKRPVKKTPRKKTSSAPKTNTMFEGTVDGVNVKVYLNINSNWSGPVTGYYKMDGAKYSLKGKFVSDSRIELVEGYDEGIWNVELGTGGNFRNPHLWLNGTTQGGGEINLIGNFQ